MNPATRPLNSRGRDRAVDRIGTLTLGTAIVGLVATGAFGALAAVTYAGSATTTGTGIGDAGPRSNSYPGSNGGYLPFQGVQVPTYQSTRPGHATSGGSRG